MINIYDLSGIYKYQDFYKNYHHRYHDLSQNSGLSCYCDDESLNLLKGLISRQTGFSINFIDSGNYHYISYINLTNINTEFKLVLFDNHPDAKTPDFPLLSCGGWILDSIDKIPLLKEIEFIGVELPLLQEAKVEMTTRGLKEKYFNEKQRNYIFGKTEAIDSLPVYISIDKDVLSEEYAHTSWSQGIMSLPTLLAQLKTLMTKNNILGIDICGETDLNTEHKSFLNENANKQLLELIIKTLPSSYERDETTKPISFL